MSTLVRRVRDQFRQSTDDTDLPPPLPPKDSKYQHPGYKRQSRCDLSTAVESAYSIQNRQNHRRQIDQSSIAGLRRRLVNRASTISLRFRNRHTDSEDLPQPLREEHRIHHFGDEEASSSLSEQVLQSNIQSFQGAILRDVILHLESRPASISVSSRTQVIPVSEFEEPKRDPSISHIHERQVQSRELEAEEQLSPTHVNINWSAMASESAAPPILYERMKDIATSACDTALSMTTKYNHADTESWNTTIINTILAALVDETTPSPASQTPAGQPQFKYVVNSTIIQHASSSAAIEEGTKSSGRRGMHSASGAYWNNEKDGMWSFKYEAAEAKGLDVVVGIIWVWVG